ncbi:DNA/RNA non-specific endonuclease [Elizabethkingia anophelis]|uniref:DNA/RNA non-specific endonuclease n=1 Tax=Elizabethkingia anophelis TaxID=1117645 RepID=UPI0009952709|nr:DNA/RNA non-specific endonuclease [Elizabethkingia anophelis]MCT3896744.1 DNA/RNA non-specific endonuclease [Elizabethkingia anophelis]MCT4285232.1 DNA/RNA non-specific endonuclease [Elizabethkingia anophelis]MCT4298645.1 DNA/RNA non-specific endonuclease [Elizabethkingia anophelis]MCT4302231.1 DNA/RNA non-specific endonuclease [Elizabethkingia anophelis]MDV3547391.1 hypothetical protein [Elizabethkingia anophelis]
MAKKYVPEGAFLACDKGTSPSTLRVSNNKNTTIYGVPMASELDFIPFFNIKPMGLCTNPLKWSTGVSCLPTIVTGWQQPKDGVKINGSRMLLEDSFCDCIFGGKINIFFDRSAAVKFGVGEGKMPTDYIKEGFDWLAEQEKQNRKARDQFLPDWMKPVTGAVDWFNDLGSGLVEGAVNGVVGLGETIYQVGQDPIGTGEALWKMGSDAVDWVSKGENWTNMANDSWNWASNGDNWGKAISDGAQWVQKNPRELGNAVGQFIPDAAAAVYSGGSSLGVSAAKVAGKEALEVGTKTALKEGVEAAAKKGVKEAVEEGTEKAAKEGLEAAGKRTTAEVMEQLAKHDGGDIAKVVTKDATEEAAKETAEKLADDVIELKPGGKGNWNKALNGKLNPNAKYKVGDKIYETDNLGRVKKVSGKLELGKLGRNNYQQGKSVTLKGGTKGVDEGGHLIGHQFKGAGEQINYVPMKGTLNQGAWKQMEGDWAKALKDGKKVDVDIQNIYSGNSQRPVGFKVKYTIDGKPYNRTFKN